VKWGRTLLKKRRWGSIERSKWHGGSDQRNNFSSMNKLKQKRSLNRKKGICTWHAYTHAFFKNSIVEVNVLLEKM
jgi:hypothetical protein